MLYTLKGMLSGILMENFLPPPPPPNQGWSPVTIIKLLAASNHWVGPQTLSWPRTVATCTEVIFAQILRGGAENVILERTCYHASCIKPKPSCRDIWLLDTFTSGMHIHLNFCSRNTSAVFSALGTNEIHGGYVFSLSFVHTR